MKLDRDDHEAIVIGLIRVIGFVALILMGALTAGLALRVFQIVSGI